MEENKDNALEPEKDFEGNYIEKFKEQKEEEFYPGGIISWKQKKGKIKIYAQHSTLELRIINEKILKFRYANDGYFEDDFSYAIDPEFELGNTNYQFENQQDSLLIKTDLLQCVIKKLMLPLKFWIKTEKF